jgi:hypothetical protein
VKAFDKSFVVLWLILSFITPVVAGWDRRLGWSPLPLADIECGRRHFPESSKSNILSYIP